MVDETEDVRRVQQLLINEGAVKPDDQTWTTDTLHRDFEVLGFMAPLVGVRRKADGKIGSLYFRHSPRVYFGWQEDR